VDAKEIASYAVICGAMLLGWQIAIQPLVQRAPVAVAVRLAPGSPTALARAAEVELIDGRVDNAAALSRESLKIAPFDVRALRVFGLAEARSGRESQADEILTLAGNWSLRDDPSHAWLIERRLRRGDYTSSFAHADTLLRRRLDVQPQIFRLFTVAGIEDAGRVTPVVAGLMSARPAWRDAYLASLQTTPQELQLAASYAVLLQAGPAPMSSEELQHLYRNLLRLQQYPAMEQIRARLNRPPPSVAVTNGDFSDPAAPEPFQWRLAQKAGLIADIVEDDLSSNNPALRIDYDGYATGIITEQLMLLKPGNYVLSSRVRIEAGGPEVQAAWVVSCAPGGENAASIPVQKTGDDNKWASVSSRFTISSACPAQWLRLEARPGDRRSMTVMWFDNLTINAAN
jgi:hypothetical protein